MPSELRRWLGDWGFIYYLGCMGALSMAGMILNFRYDNNAEVILMALNTMLCFTGFGVWLHKRFLEGRRSHHRFVLSGNGVDADWRSVLRVAPSGDSRPPG